MIQLTPSSNSETVSKVGTSSLHLESEKFNSATAHRAILALGGGGARGLAHLGSLKALDVFGIGVKRVVGTSMGSLVGAIFAANNTLHESTQAAINYIRSDAFQTEQERLCGANPKTSGTSSRKGLVETRSSLLGWYDHIKNYLWARHLLSRVFRRRSMLGGQVMTKVVEELLPDIDISETKIPLSIVTVDLKSGRQVVLERGPLRRAVLASAAIPGIFPPIDWEGMLLCDFGVLQSLPTEVAQSYVRHDSDIVIASDVGPLMQHIEDCPSALHVLLRMDEISEQLLRNHSRKLAEVLIRPEVGHFEWFDFSQPEHLIDAGFHAGKNTLAKVWSCIQA